MFDARLRPLIDPPLNWLGGLLARRGVTANQVTASAVGAGLISAFFIASGLTTLGLIFILLSRLFDGLDGAVARATKPSDLGGYFDILGDFIFYVSVPVAFALADSANAVAAAVLLSTFTVTGISFLAYAIIAAKRGHVTTAHGKKSFFYSTGLAEGAETIVVFILMCFWPAEFVTIAYIYAGLCALTVIQRTLMTVRDFPK